MARDKIITEARERFEYAKEQWGEIYKSVREDLEFSDPTNPKQWPEQVVLERQNATGGPRPCYVFDQTGQFVRQVVNTARRNKPAMKFLPVTSLMNTDQLSRYLESVQKDFAAKGVYLEFPLEAAA